LYAGDKQTLDQALADYARAIALEPTFSCAHKNRGLAYLSKGDLDSAFREAEAVIHLKRPNSIRQFIRETVYAYHGRGQQKDCYCPATGYELRGRVHAQKKVYQRALADFNMALDLRPDLIEALISRGQLYISGQEFDLAEKDFQEVIRLESPKIRPDQEDFNALADAYYGHGVVQGKQADGHRLRGEGDAQKRANQRALADYTKAIGFRPGFTQALLSRGYLYLSEHELDLAEKDFREVVRLDSPKTRPGQEHFGLADAYYGCGAVHLQKKECEQAIRALTEAIAHDGSFALAYLIRGDAYSCLNQGDKANADWNKAGELDPSLKKSASPPK
jgi:tetratricopeptide (TPR) repeat protein